MSLFQWLVCWYHADQQSISPNKQEYCSFIKLSKSEAQVGYGREFKDSNELN